MGASTSSPAAEKEAPKLPPSLTIPAGVFRLSPSWKPKDVTKEELVLPQASDAGKVAFVLSGVLLPDECQGLIAVSEAHGYSPALVNTSGGQLLLPEIRNNSRSMIDDAEFGDALFQRLRPFLPATFRDHAVEELNERMRFLKYGAGEKFASHKDGNFQRAAPHPKAGDVSFVTVQVYLNDGYTGGATRFLTPEEEDFDGATPPPSAVDVNGTTGQVLIFQHDILHCGAELATGQKYALRTDVMYTRR